MSLTSPSPLQPLQFFIAGGTLPLQSSSYVERNADKALQEALLKGRFCYVLNSRQMGKSSLCVRTMARLEEAGVNCAFVDITKIGGRNVTPEQWYAGLLVEVGRALNLRQEFLDYWKSESHLSPMQRFFGALHDVALKNIPGRIVIFVDEIDSTRSLSFSTDEFFAGVRECFNRRVQEPAYERLTFCFLGVAVPSDLIHDARTTPFNIGERIYLKDFTYEEVKPLEKMLGVNGEQLLKRVFYWTNGHPFLTQSICRALVEREATSEQDVDNLIYRDLLEPKVRETNINLSDVGNRVLNGYADSDDIARFRADILSAYGKALSGKETLQDDESNRITAVLKLSGLMRSEGKSLKVRNRIYRKAFDKAWIRENMPGQELRRQKRAFYLGVLRTAFVAGVVLAVIGYLAIANFRLARKNAELARKSQYAAYVATMNSMPTVYGQLNLTRMSSLLHDHATESWRGLEWNFWDRMAHQADYESPALGDVAGIVAYSQDGREAAVPNFGQVIFIDTGNGKILRTIGTAAKERTFLSWMPGSQQIVSFPQSGGGSILDVNTGDIVYTLPKTFRPVNGALAISKSGLGAVVMNDGHKLGVFNYLTHQLRLLDITADDSFPTFSPDGSTFVCSTNMKSNEPVVRFYNVADLKVRRDVKDRKLFFPVRHAFFPDGKHTLVGTDEGKIAMLEVATGKILWIESLDHAAVGSLIISPDGRHLAVTTRNRKAYLYEIGLTGAKQLRVFPEANQAAILANGVFATNYFNLKFYRLTSKTPVVEDRYADGTLGFAVKEVGGQDQLVVAGPNKTWIYSIVDGRRVLAKEANGGRGNLVSGSPNGWLGVYSSSAGTVIQDRFERIPLLRLEKQTARASIEDFGDRKFAYCIDERNIKFYDGKQGRELWSVKWPNKVMAVLSNHSHSGVLVGDQQNRLGMIQVSTGKILWSNAESKDPLAGHSQGLRGGSFSLDDHLVVTASDDDTAALWDTSTGARLVTFRGHAQSVADAAISFDDSRVATISEDQTLRIWDAKTGLELTTLGSPGNAPQRIIFTKDGKYIATFAIDNVMRLWPISPRLPGRMADD